MPEFESPREQVRYLLKKNQRSMSWLERQTGISKQNITNWTKPTNPTDPRDASSWDILLAAFDATALDRPRPVEGTAYVPTMKFAGLVPAGDWGDPLSSEEIIEVDYKFVHNKRFAARVIGDSCFPALVQGDLTIWHTEPNPPYGRIVLAQRKGDHGCTVKELAYDVQESRPMLKPVNPRYVNPTDGDGWGVVAYLVGLVREDVDGIEESYYNQRGFTVKQLRRFSADRYLDIK